MFHQFKFESEKAMISASKGNDNPTMLLALKVLTEQANKVPVNYREDLVFLISWYLFNPMWDEQSDKVWIMIQNYMSHFINAKEGEPDFTILKHEIEKDPAQVQKRLGVPQRQLASEAGLPNQQAISRFREVDKKDPDKIRRMTAVLALHKGLGNRLR